MGLAYQQRGGFTLVELLMVVAIIALLMAIALPVMGLAARAAKRSATQATLSKVEAGLLNYGREMRCLPFQAEYPVVGPLERWQATSFANRLAHFVASQAPVADADLVRADVDAVTAAYRYDLVLEATPEWNSNRFYMDWNATEATAGPMAIRAGQVLWERLTGNGNAVHIWGLGDPFTMDGNAKRGARNLPAAVMVNRLFQERGRRAILAGNLALAGTRAVRPPVNGTYPPRSYPACEYDRRGQRVLAAAAAQSTASPGWAIDYLGADLEPRARQGESVVDAWGRPLIYICQLAPGIERSPFMDRGDIVPFDTRFYGMRSRPVFPADLAVSTRAELGLDGRFLLSSQDCGWGEPTPTDATYFPDTARLMDSDMRYFAAPPFVRDFELWSAGPDGTFCWRRSDGANRDNIAVRPYAKGLE